MKKGNRIATILVACTLFSPLFALYACQAFPQEHSAESSIQSTSSSHSASNSTGAETEEDSAQTDNTPTPPQKPTPVSKTAQYLRCTGTNVNIRKGAGTNYQVLGSANKGDTFIILGQSGSWYKTFYRNQTAYVYASYAHLFALQKSANTQVEKVIDEGYKLLGTPYVYGATRLHDGTGKLLAGFSVQKFDCSSLIQYVFYKGANVKLGAHSRAQVLQGEYVPSDQIQRGDCLFFTNEDRKDKTGIERVGHVALYLGNNYILHTASDYACIEQISDYRWGYFIQARRFL